MCNSSKSNPYCSEGIVNKRNTWSPLLRDISDLEGMLPKHNQHQVNLTL